MITPKSNLFGPIKTAVPASNAGPAVSNISPVVINVRAVTVSKPTPVQSPADIQPRKRVLSLDIATNCGWAHSCGVSGVWDLSSRRDESAGMKLIRMEEKLLAIQKTVGIDVLVFEAARHAAPFMQGALVCQAELQGVVKRWCEAQVPKIEYCGYSPKEIKKFATGSGNAKKDQMIAAAIQKWPEKAKTVSVLLKKYPKGFEGKKESKLVQVIDDNEADALHLLALATEQMQL